MSNSWIEGQPGTAADRVTGQSGATDQQARRAMSGRGGEHELAWVTAGLARAARAAGVELPATYARRVVAEGLRLCDQLGVTRLGDGVVLHSAPDTGTQLPVVLGYADAAGQWYRDGTRHTPPPPATQPDLGGEAVGL